MADVSRPRLVLVLEPVSGPDVRIAAWQLETDQSANVVEDIPGVGTALSILNEYQPGKPLDPPPVPA